MSESCGYRWRGVPLEEMTKEELVYALAQQIQMSKEQCETHAQSWENLHRMREQRSIAENKYLFPAFFMTFFS
ncbi:MAG TPA: hypothetical protein VIY48_18590 [Candidatus Paceibacterota bacterium]